jgi:predicted nucleic acid-binding protein
VAAIEHAFSEAPPDELYLDTDFIVGCLERTDPHHARCAAFMRHVASGARTMLYISSLSWLEFIHTITRERFREIASAELRQRFRLDHWDEASVRRAYVAQLTSDFEVLLSQCDWTEVWLTPAIRADAIDMIATYNLNTHDAVHLATMRDMGVVHLASLDRGFRRVDGLHLWNDRMYDSS